MVEYYPATVEIGVRFPDDAFLFYFFTFLFFDFALETANSVCFRRLVCADVGPLWRCGRLLL